MKSRNEPNTWDVSVSFHSLVDLNSALVSEKYDLPGHTIQAVRVQRSHHAVILSVPSLASGGEYTLNLSGLVNTSGETLPSSSHSFKARHLAWTVVGQEELGFSSEALAVGSNAFILTSGASQLFDRYDEATFLYERVNGDFDKKVRVVFQEDSSAYARSGLMVREHLDAGKQRPSDPFDPAQAFSRYLSLHATPGKTAHGPLGSETHQVNIRYFPGGIGSSNFDATENPALVNNAPPVASNSWLRISRTGQIFRTFRSSDGENWHLLGTFEFPTQDALGNPVTPFSSMVFVGPCYSPELLNIPVASGARRTFFALFDQYSASSGETPGDLEVVLRNNEVELSWTGTAVLQKNTRALTTGWLDVPNAVSPLRFRPSAPQEYYRLRLDN